MMTPREDKRHMPTDLHNLNNQNLLGCRRLTRDNNLYNNTKSDYSWPIYQYFNTN